MVLDRLLLIPLLLSLLTLRAGLAAEHEAPWDRVGAFVDDAASQPADALTGRCPVPPPDGACTYNYPRLRETCEVRDTAKLGRFGEDRYIVARYLRTTVFDGGAGGEPFACGADEIVLAALSGDGRARVVWRDATERSFWFISSASLVTTPGGERILAVLYCVNGTGGCAQGMLIWVGEAWQQLERDDSWAPVYRDLPAGYRPHKSPEIDLGELTWEQHLAHRDDANCCPSGRIDFRLAIVDGKLAVKSYRIVVPEAAPPDN